MTPALPTLEVATAEALVLDLEVAGLGHRALAWFVDAAIIATAWFTVLFAISYARTFDLTRAGDLSVALQLLLVGAFFFTNWGYGLVFESAWHGQTPGKRWLGLRVVRADGSPAGLPELALRNLCRAVDFLPLLYVTGVVTMMLTNPTRRLGDLLAGTLVIRAQRFDLSRYRAPAPSARLDLAPLAPAQLELVLAFLSRAPSLDPSPRDALAFKLAALFADRLPEASREAARSDPAAAEAFLRALARGDA